MVKWRVYIEFVYSPFFIMPFSLSFLLFFFFGFAEKSMPFVPTPFWDSDEKLCFENAGCVRIKKKFPPTNNFYMQLHIKLSKKKLAVLSEMPYITCSTI